VYHNISNKAPFLSSGN